MNALRCHCTAKISNIGALHAPLEVRSTLKPSSLFFVATLFFSVVVAENDALATNAQSITGGTSRAKRRSVLWSGLRPGNELRTKI